MFRYFGLSYLVWEFGINKGFGIGGIVYKLIDERKFNPLSGAGVGGLQYLDKRYLNLICILRIEVRR